MGMLQWGTAGLGVLGDSEFAVCYTAQVPHYRHIHAQRRAVIVAADSVYLLCLQTHKHTHTPNGPALQTPARAKREMAFRRQ
jgi:hypothetical protein